MTISTWVFGKANPSSNLAVLRNSLRRYSNVSSAAPTNGTANHLNAVDAQVQRDLFVNVLNANATKRDAKQYLARFQIANPKPRGTLKLQEDSNARNQDRLDRMGVNLGALYTPGRAIAESPTFVREHVANQSSMDAQPIIHVALVCLRSPETLDASTLDGVALTLSQLVKLDMRILVVLDAGSQSSNKDHKGIKERKGQIAKQAYRLQQAIEKHNPEGARLVNGSIEVQESTSTNVVTVEMPRLLLDPLERSIIPIVSTLAHTPSGQIVHASASGIMAAMSVMLSNRQTPVEALSGNRTPFQTSLDRIILLDSAGGIPSRARGDAAHVLINLEQEFGDIQEELREYGNQSGTQTSLNPPSSVYERHQANLHVLRTCLAMLPSASSALIITPEEAASSSQTPSAGKSSTGTGTRRQKNTLIHNLLTNKPMVSSSLPVARVPSLATTDEETPHRDVSSSTLVKRGMPVTIIPATRLGQGWEFPAAGTTELDLQSDPQVDLPRLAHLIEDSFRRKLDLEHYLKRVRGHIAGLIIAGSYEGGAILTWEQPPGTSDPLRVVPYLDKFAVLSSSQGSSGVADILFQSMVRTCFPDGVCWRSRKDNPVNKWYFERADGHWQIPGTNWTMFWTGEGVVEDEQRWKDYVSVCESIGASWADGKKPD